MDSAVERTTITVAAEWALWGKAESDRGYRLLDHSDGNLTSDNFKEVLTRYSPGTLDRLPQVTVSWFSKTEDRNFLAIAIHDKGETGQFDADGREITFTRYFCVPYDNLTAVPSSYLAMYEEFSKFVLPAPDRALIETQLTTVPLGMSYDTNTMRVAALLLTGKPVCIVGADQVELHKRLQFLDAVVSLLPYGMRCRLSASTWASSTSQTLKFRLFFASRPRPARDEPSDHVVEWGRVDRMPIGHRYADDYLRWLESEVQQPVTRLTTYSQPLGFSQPEILKMLEILDVPSGRPAIQPHPDRRGLVASRWHFATEPMRVMTPEQLLIACAEYLDGPNPGFIKSYIEPMRAYLGKPTQEQRLHYQNLIKKHRLLTENPRIDKSLQAKFYGALLLLAFTTPLTYSSYCEIEECSGNADDEPLSQTLLKEMESAGFRDYAAYLLVINALYGKGITRKLNKDKIDPDQLIDVVANSPVRPRHAQILCSIVVQFVSERTGNEERDTLRSALSRQGYLASFLNWCYAHDPEYQLAVLTTLMHSVHGGELDEAAIAGALSDHDHVPTAALLAAVLKMVRHEDTERVLLEFCRGLVGSTVFSDQTRSLLMQRLSGDQPEVVQGMDLVPFSVRSSLPEKRRPRDWLRDQWPLKG